MRAALLLAVFLGLTAGGDAAAAPHQPTYKGLPEEVRHDLAAARRNCHAVHAVTAKDRMAGVLPIDFDGQGTQGFLFDAGLSCSREVACGGHICGLAAYVQEGAHGWRRVLQEAAVVAWTMTREAPTELRLTLAGDDARCSGGADRLCRIDLAWHDGGFARSTPH